MTAADDGSGIFISYRREDASGHAGRIYDGLASRFGRGRVFMDVDAIRPGSDFVARIEGAVDRCAVLLAVIGPRWAGASMPDGRRRLDDPDDFVALEIAAALARPAITVIPVLVQGAQMPPVDDLPAHIRPLSRKSALTLDDARWGYDLGQLVGAVDDALPGIETMRPEADRAGEQRRRTPALLAGAVGLALVVATLVAISALRSQGTDAPETSASLTGRLAFTTGLTVTSPVWLNDTLTDHAQIAVLSLPTGSVELIARVPRGACCAAWSPDGSAIAFESREGIWIQRGSSERELIVKESGNIASVTWDQGLTGPARPVTVGTLHPAWSPDGTQLVYTYDALADGHVTRDELDRAGLWVVTLDGHRTQLTAPSREARDGDRSAAWAPGTRLAFVRIERGSGTTPPQYTIEATSGVTGSREEQVLSSGDDLLSGLAWSPDGVHLAFARTPAGQDPADIFIVSPDGTIDRLTDNPADDRDPAWSPDGELIAFVSNRDGQYDLYVMNADGTGVQRLTDTPDAECCLSWTA